MTAFTTVWSETRSPLDAVIGEWDGRPTAAIARDHDGVEQLLWLLWDHAPQFEVWLRLPLEGTEVAGLATKAPELLSDFVVQLAGRQASIEVFNPRCDDPFKSTTAVDWTIPHVEGRQLALEAARTLADILTQLPALDQPPSLRDLLPEVSRSMASYAGAR